MITSMMRLSLWKVWEKETTVVKPVLSRHLYAGAVTVEGVGKGDYSG